MKIDILVSIWWKSNLEPMHHSRNDKDIRVISGAESSE